MTQRPHGTSSGQRMDARCLLAALPLILFGALTCLGAEVPPPRPGTFVHDFAEVIADDREAEIQVKAQRLRDEYKTEIAVVTIDSLQGEESFDYSMRMARSWGIGSKDNDVRGLLILVAVNDRKTAFRTSRHVEGELPDGVTGEISREMNAYFKQNDFGGGLSAGMDGIFKRMREVYEHQPAAAQTAAPGSRLGWLWLPVVGVPALGLGYVMLRRRGRKRREADAARQSGNRSGFREWAATKDPSKTRHPKRKSQDITRAGSYPTTRKTKKKTASHSGGAAPTYGYESSGYDSSSSSSSYDSGSSSSSDSGSSYSGGSDFGGGGSDSSW